MRLCLLLLIFFINFTLYGGTRMPCQIVGFDDVAEEAIPVPGTPSSIGITNKNREEEIIVLKNCIKKYAVCIVEAPPRNRSWLDTKLIEPSDNKNFDPAETHLIFGVIQYVDKKTGNQICMAAINNVIGRAVPWYGVSWISDRQTIKQYELRGARFNTVMTPKSLYRSLLASQKNPAIKNKLIKSYNVAG